MKYEVKFTGQFKQEKNWMKNIVTIARVVIMPVAGNAMWNRIGY